jgi:broad specificity phosphatase PhoE
VSPLERARESAEILRQIAGGPEARIDPRLTEASEWREGLPRAFSIRPTLGRLVFERRWGAIEFPWRIAERVSASIEECVRASRGADTDVAFVSHQTPIRLGRFAFERASGERTKLRRLLPWIGFRYPCATASITTLHFDGDSFVRADYQPASGL